MSVTSLTKKILVAHLIFLIGVTLINATCTYTNKNGATIQPGDPQQIICNAQEDVDVDSVICEVTVDGQADVTLGDYAGTPITSYVQSTSVFDGTATDVKFTIIASIDEITDTTTKSITGALNCGGSPNDMFILSINPVNDHTPEFSNDGGDYSLTGVSEAFPPNIDLLQFYSVQITSSDGDTNGDSSSIMDFSIIDGDDQGTFQMGKDESTCNNTYCSATLFVVGKLDFLNYPSYDLTIQVMDEGTPSLSSPGTLHIEIVDADNLNPQFQSTFYYSTADSINSGKYPLTTTPTPILAQDQDTGINAPIEYNLVIDTTCGASCDAMNQAFSIDSTSGIITIDSDVDLTPISTGVATFGVQAVQTDNPDRSTLAIVSVTLPAPPTTTAPATTTETTTTTEPTTTEATTTTEPTTTTPQTTTACPTLPPTTTTLTTTPTTTTTTVVTTMETTITTCSTITIPIDDTTTPEPTTTPELTTTTTEPTTTGLTSTGATCYCPTTDKDTTPTVITLTTTDCATDATITTASTFTSSTTPYTITTNTGSTVTITTSGDNTATPATSYTCSPTDQTTLSTATVTGSTTSKISTDCTSFPTDTTIPSTGSTTPFTGSTPTVDPTATSSSSASTTPFTGTTTLNTGTTTQYTGTTTQYTGTTTQYTGTTTQYTGTVTIPTGMTCYPTGSTDPFTGTTGTGTTPTGQTTGTTGTGTTPTGQTTGTTGTGTTPTGQTTGTTGTGTTPTGQTTGTTGTGTTPTGQTTGTTGTGTTPTGQTTGTIGTGTQPTGQTTETQVTGSATCPTTTCPTTTCPTTTCPTTTCPSCPTTPTTASPDHKGIVGEVIVVSVLTPVNTIIVKVTDTYSVSPLTFALTGGEEYFDINDDGSIYVKSYLQVNNYILDVTITLEGDAAFSDKLQVNISVVNDESYPILPENFYVVSIDENQISIEEPLVDLDSPLEKNLIASYSIINASSYADKFSIDETNGKLYLNTTFDCETEATSIDVIVQVDPSNTDLFQLIADPNINFNQYLVNVKINDVNDNPPTFGDASALTVAISSYTTSGQQVTQLTATDRDVDPKNREIFYKSTDSKNNFYIDKNTGVLLASQPVNSLNGSYTITVTATNDLSNPSLDSTPLSVTINILEQTQILVINSSYTVEDFEDNHETILDDLSKSLNSGLYLRATGAIQIDALKWVAENAGTKAYLYGIQNSAVMSKDDLLNLVKNNDAAFTTAKFVPSTAQTFDQTPEAVVPVVDNNSDSSSDNTGLIAGISVLAVLLGICLIVGGVFGYKSYKKKHELEKFYEDNNDDKLEANRKSSYDKQSDHNNMMYNERRMSQAINHSVNSHEFEEDHLPMHDEDILEEVIHQENNSQPTPDYKEESPTAELNDVLREFQTVDNLNEINDFPQHEQSDSNYIPEIESPIADYNNEIHRASLLDEEPKSILIDSNASDTDTLEDLQRKEELSVTFDEVAEIIEVEEHAPHDNLVMGELYDEEQLE